MVLVSAQHSLKACTSWYQTFVSLHWTVPTITNPSNTIMIVGLLRSFHHSRPCNVL